jgi:lipopolysaccharide/colanic/teichoic acid biosynthesis glycosyltransferase
MLYKLFIKRLSDIVLSSIALIFLTPLLIPCMLGLLLTGEHYIFYFQKRIGFKNKKFYIWKFATMLKNSPNIGNKLHTTKNDPRIMPMGNFLRKTKINELPQLINIFLGSMSIVGPRPLVDKTFAPYSDLVKKSIYNVKPGLTGIGSIVFRDEEELMSKTNVSLENFYNNVISPHKGELELWYQNKQSFKVDFMIIFLTIWVVIFPSSSLVYTVFKDLPKKPIALT